MPIGIIVDCIIVLLGGLVGAFAGKAIPVKTRDYLNIVLGFGSMSIGINSIVKVNNMTPVIIAVVVGSLIGSLLDLEHNLVKVIGMPVRMIPHDESTFNMDMLVTGVVLFCASGFGIYGVFVEGMSGDASILLSKSVLDFFTAATFAISLGIIVACIAAPMFIIMMVLFFIATLLRDVVSATMLKDFVACGGILTLAAGLRVSGTRNSPITNMIPALILVLPCSALWTMLMG